MKFNLFNRLSRVRAALKSLRSPSELVYLAIYVCTAIAHRRHLLRSKDRIILELMLFRKCFASSSLRKILFVGCHDYSWWYYRLFGLSSKKFFVCDPSYKNPELEKYDGFFPVTIGNFPSSYDAQIDLVFLNGVIGYGLDSPDAVEDAIRKIHKLLSPNSFLVVGFSDGKHNHLMEGEYWKDNFKKADFPGLSVGCIPSFSDNRHTFQCYTKL